MAPPKQPQHRRALGGSRACRGVGCDRTRGFRARLAWVGAIAAAVLIAVAATAFMLDRQFGERLAASEAASAGLASVTATTVALSSEADAEQVRLAGAEDRWGRVVYSADKGEACRDRQRLTEPAGDREVPLLGRDRRAAHAGRQDVLRR